MSAYWKPFTANRAFDAAPRTMTSASGMYYRDADGREVLDGMSGLWCVNAGHGRPQIAEAVASQLQKLDYAPAFHFSHEGAELLADRLIALAPPGFGSVFFSNSGSESVETALKIALAYHRARGEPGRVRLVGRLKGYHGVNFGGMSVGGIQRNRAQFGQLLPNVDHLRDTHLGQRTAFTRGQPKEGAERADDLLHVIALHGAEAIAAVIVEPMAGSAGVLVPPMGYLERLRELCDASGVLLIFDEVICGFGRLGAAFGAQRYGVTPDLITVAKGLTNGAVPMGAVLAREGIREAVLAAATEPIEFFHGYTYSAHPVACAAAHAALDVYAGEALFERARALSPAWQDAVHTLRQSPNVIDVRSDGLVAGVELAAGPAGSGRRGFAVFEDCLRRGLLVRVTGDTIALAPPLIIQPSEIDRLVSTLAAALAASD